MRQPVELVVAETARALGSPVVSHQPVHGGDVAASYRLDLRDGRRVFAKTHVTAPPGFFSTEAAGLGWLRGASPLAVPEVLAVSDEPPLLVLEWIDEGPPSERADQEFGTGLAALHLAGAPCFGREDRRTTGSRRLPNEPCATWADFYADNRLRPLAGLAADAGVLSTGAVDGLERIASVLEEFGAADERPSRLHGDLWSGNRLFDARGANWLIDPAAHGGHREFDLAMMRLFGGFGEGCFAAYAAAFPLSDGWEDRVILHQLAPLTVHAIKFGGGYIGATERAIAALAG